MVHPPASLSRRHVLHLLGGSALALGGLALVSPGSVEARRVWCRLDPTFRVNGIIGNVYVSGELDRAYDTTGPIQMTFVAPSGSVVELLFADDGFGHGYDIRIAYDDELKNDEKRIGLEIEVLVPAFTSDLPILVEFVPDSTIEVADKKEGKTNEAIRVKTELRRPEPLDDPGSGSSPAPETTPAPESTPEPEPTRVVEPKPKPKPKKAKPKRKPKPKPKTAPNG